MFTRESLMGNNYSLQHGGARGGKMSPEYAAWNNAWQRCTNPNNASFKHYGGRGIQVCKRWKKFEVFVVDMGLRPSSEHSLDRKNNEGNYTPSNCRWATQQEQRNNTRANRRIQAFGEVKNLTQWSREQGIPLDTLWRRLVIWKWPPEKALSQSLRVKHPLALQLVKAAGFESVSAFLRAKKLYPVPFYNAIKGQGSEAVRLKVEVALGFKL